MGRWEDCIKDNIEGFWVWMAVGGWRYIGSDWLYQYETLEFAKSLLLLVC